MESNVALKIGVAGAVGAVALSGVALARAIPGTLWKTLLTPVEPGATTGSANSIPRTTAPPVSVSGKVIFITGASSGLGLATAKALGSMGAKLVVAYKYGRPGETKDDGVRRALGASLLAIIHVDLGDLSSVRECVAEYVTRGLPPTDVIILNAGVVTSTTAPTKHGLGAMVGINYVGHFALANALAGDARCFRRDCTRTDPSRIIAVASEGHRVAPLLDPRSVLRVRPIRVATALTEYGVSKQLLISFMSELQRRLNRDGSNAVCLALCPGAMNTNIVPRDNVPPPLRGAARAMMGAFFKSPEKAAENLVRLVRVPIGDRERATLSSRCVYFHMATEKSPRPDSTDPTIGEQLWAETVALIKSLDSGNPPPISASL